VKTLIVQIRESKNQHDHSKLEQRIKTNSRTTVRGHNYTCKIYGLMWYPGLDPGTEKEHRWKN